MEEFLLEQWVEKASVKVPGKAAPLRGEALLEALKRVLEFRTLFGKLARRGVPGAVLDALVRKKFRASKRGVGDAEIAAAVAEAAAEQPGGSAHVASENGDAGTIVVAGPHPAHFSVDVLKSPDYAQLLDLHAEIAGMHKGPCVIVDASEKETTTHSLDELMRVIMDMAKDGATLQRYKGLGEMNPEQLWETTLDVNARLLLRVQVRQADEAGDLFSKLMGDDVEPRRDFIRENALSVANLDV
jgi:DNA gyrase subunit B